MPRIRAGDVLLINEADYCYGIGPLKIQVNAIGRPRGQINGLEWLGVTGVEIRWNGTEGGHRSVLVRTSALAEALRRGSERQNQDH
jgi:hypothetical protein